MPEPNTTETTASATKPLSALERMVRENQVLEALRGVYDPEIPVNIYELGLIYDLKIEDSGKVDITMTLTAPTCPEAGMIPGRVQNAVSQVSGITEVNVNLVWEPAWNPNKMSDAAKLQLGLM